MNLNRVSGLVLIVAAVTFVGGWLLMPDAGTADAAHILDVVSGQRAGVWWSVVAHLVSSIAFVTAVVGIQTDPIVNASPLARAGAWLVLVGAVGVCMDAFFHLVAYYFTAPGVAAAAILEPMRLLQTKGIAFLVPLLISLIVGGMVYTLALWRVAVTTAWPFRVVVTAIGIAMVGGTAAAGLGQGRREVVLGFLILLAIGYGWAGYEIATGRRRQVAA